MNWACRLNHRRREDCGIECLRNQVAGLELDIDVYKRGAEAAGRIAIDLRKQVVELVDALEYIEGYVESAVEFTPSLSGLLGDVSRYLAKARTIYLTLNAEITGRASGPG